MFWLLHDLASFDIAAPAGAAFALCFVMFFDYLFLLPRHFLRQAVRGPAQPSNDRLPSGLLVIPSLLRATDELEAIKTTIANVIQNDYPGDMQVVVSIDGTTDAPALYDDLAAWIAGQQATLPKDVALRITGTRHRRGKPLAIEHGFEHLTQIVAKGELAVFPQIYFSTDADADLGPNALEHLARRLVAKNLVTGNPGRAVAGNLHVRGNTFWKGWRHFFTHEGQLSIQVAREYLVSNVARYNLKPMPISGITGVLYCTWTDIMRFGPKYMGFMRTLTAKDWIKWWLGAAPPKFSESAVAPIPELLAGDTDDTVGAFLAIASRWENGKLTLDAPRSPLHAFYYMLRSVFIDRALRYEPNARVYTSSPPTVGALWKQRMRWNAARIEVVGRFSKSFRYHWDLGVSSAASVGLMMKALLFGLFAYIAAPLAIARGGVIVPVPVALGLAMQLSVYGLSTLLCLVLDGTLRKQWRLLLALPASCLYVPVYGFWAGAVGIMKDLFGVGNITKFAPETTLIKGGSSRIALFARGRRFFALVVRSAVYGDVPFGRFWFGWDETPWTPSGYAGWSTNERPTFMQRLRYGAEPTLEAAPKSRVSLALPAALARIDDVVLSEVELTMVGVAQNDSELPPPSRRPPARTFAVHRDAAPISVSDGAKRAA